MTVVFTLAACSSKANTNVRVLSLSYGKEAAALVSSNQSIKLLSFNKLNTDTPEHVFPGDMLIFTIELEDPDFEFITLLAVTFNGIAYRANVEDSIFSTRDCGANICIEFSYEIKDKDEYVVNEVKFAKISSESGVSAIIDRNSNNKIELNVYREETAIYVLEAVSKFNAMISELTYYDGSLTYSNDEMHSIISDRTLKGTFHILNSDRFFGEHIFYSIGPTHTVDGRFGPEQRFFNFGNNEVFYVEQVIQLMEIFSYFEISGRYREVNLPGWFIYFNLYESRFQSTYFYNEGNKIYVNILGENYFVIEFFQDMRLKAAQEYLS